VIKIPNQSLKDIGSQNIIVEWGEKKRPRNPTCQKTNISIEDSVGNEENKYSVPDPNKTIINITNEVSDTHKNSLKEEFMDEITEKLMEKLQDRVKQKVQDSLKKYQDTTNKKT
jgi:hypothetical protein